MRKSQIKKKSTTGATSIIPLDSSLTSIEWLPNMQIGESQSAQSSFHSPLAPSTPSSKQSLPTTTYVQHKTEALEVDDPNSLVHDSGHSKPPFSYVTLIRQAISSTKMQRMTLNEIYQWIIDSYPYFRSAPPKWKNSIRHNLSLNKCFKRLPRSTNDPGKGSYWAVDESSETQNQINNRKRKFEEIQPSPHIFPNSPAIFIHPPSDFCINNNPMICGDMSSVGGQSSSTDESECPISFIQNHTTLMPTDDLNLDLTASFRRFREQVLDAPSGIWTDPSLSYNHSNNTFWPADVFPHGESNSFLESIRLASSGEINWNDIDVKPYCEFLDGFRTNSATFQQQDRDKLLNLASSLTSFFDHAGITNLAQSRIAHDQSTTNRLPVIPNRSVNNSNSLPVEMEEEHAFDWDSIA